MRVVAQKRRDADDESWGAEVALQSVMVPESRLHAGERTVGRRHALDCRDRASVGLNGKDETGAHGFAVQKHRAGAAHAVLATEVGSGEAAPLAQEIGEREARLDGVT